LWKWVRRPTDHGTANRTAHAGAGNTPSGYGQPNYGANLCPGHSAWLYACTVSPVVW
jgi:hypothetical protein